MFTAIRAKTCVLPKMKGGSLILDHKYRVTSRRGKQVSLRKLKYVYIAEMQFINGPFRLQRALQILTSY